MRLLIGLALTAMVIGPPLLHGQGGRLQQVRDEVRKSDPSPGEKEADHSSSDCPSDFCGPDDHSCGACLGEILGPGFVFVFASPFWIPYQALGDDLQTYRYFAKHPYQAGYPGYLLRNLAGSAELAGTWSERMHPKAWAVRLTVEDGDDFAGLKRFHGQFRLDTTSRFGFVTNWNAFHERLGGGCDALVLGDFNLTYRFAQSETAALRAGLGARVLADRYSNNWGFNFNYGGEVFPVRPLVLTADLDLGSLGSAFVFHARGTAGMIWRGWEVFTGYDFLRIGAVNLQGPLVGVRFWF